MKRKPFIAGVLSLLVPGLGQVYGGESQRGAAIIAAAIVIGSLNIIILPLISLANPATPPTGTLEAKAIWAYWIPRAGHDLVSVWSITFWLWAIFDAVSVTRRKRSGAVRNAMELHQEKAGARMDRPRLVDTFLKVKDMDRAVRFYETFLGVKAEYRYKDRWVSITDGLGLYNPAYDVEHDVPMTEYDRETRVGNNVVVVFGADDIEREHDRVQSLGATGVTDIVEINLMAPYRFFQFQDTEGNLVEVGRMD